MTPLYMVMLNNQVALIFGMIFFRFLNLFGHTAYTCSCYFAASETSTLIVITTLRVSKLSYKIQDMPLAMSCQCFENTELEYHQRRFSTRNTTLLYTIHLQVVQVHANIRAILFIHAHLTIDHNALQCGTWHCNFISMCGVIGLRFVDVTQGGISPIHEPRVQCCRIALESGTTAEAGIRKGLYKYKTYIEALLGRQRYERGVMQYTAFVIFRLWRLQYLSVS